RRLRVHPRRGVTAKLFVSQEEARRRVRRERRLAPARPAPNVEKSAVSGRDQQRHRRALLGPPVASHPSNVRLASLYRRNGACLRGARNPDRAYRQSARRCCGAIPALRLPMAKRGGKATRTSAPTKRDRQDFRRLVRKVGREKLAQWTKEPLLEE